MHVKTIVRHPYTLTRMVKMKTILTIATDGKEEEQLGFSHFNGGSVNKYTHLENRLAVSTRTGPGTHPTKVRKYMH